MHGLAIVTQESYAPCVNYKFSAFNVIFKNISFKQILNYFNSNKVEFFEYYKVTTFFCCRPK